MPNFLLKRGKKEKLIVETSATGMHAIQMVRADDVPKVENAFSQTWSHRLVLTEEELEARIEKAVKSLAEQFAPKQFSIVFCCADASNVQKLVQGPVIEDEEELEEWLLSKKHMPSQDDYVSDFAIQGDSFSDLKKTQDILVHTVSKQVAQVAMDALEEGGYELEALEYPSNALSSIHALWFPDTDQLHDVILHVGPETVAITFFYEGVARFSHIVPFSLLGFLDVMMEKGHMEAEAAREFALQGLMPCLYDGVESPLSQEILEPVRAEFVWLIEELKRTCAYYYCRVLEWKAALPSRIMCTGIEAFSPGFQQELRDRIGCNVEAFSLLESVAASENIEARLGMDQWGSHIMWAVALGTRYMDE